MSLKVGDKIIVKRDKTEWTVKKVLKNGNVILTNNKTSLSGATMRTETKADVRQKSKVLEILKKRKKV